VKPLKSLKTDSQMAIRRFSVAGAARDSGNGAKHRACCPAARPPGGFL
jgi:hypothetical protein